MKSPKRSGDFESPPEGWTTAVCTRVVDLGTHYNPRSLKDERKLKIGFEVAHKMTQGEYAGQPFLIWSTFNFSTFKNAHLCKFIQSWRGKRFASQDEADNFDFSKLLRQPAYFNIVESEDGQFTNIESIGPVPSDRQAPVPVGHIILIDQDNLDMSMVEKLSPKMKEKVMNAKERVEGSASTSGSHPNYDKAPKKPDPMEQSLRDAGMLDEGDRNPPPVLDDFDDDIPF